MCSMERVPIRREHARNAKPTMTSVPKRHTAALDFFRSGVRGVECRKEVNGGCAPALRKQASRASSCRTLRGEIVRSEAPVCRKVFAELCWSAPSCRARYSSAHSRGARRKPAVTCLVIGRFHSNHPCPSSGRSVRPYARERQPAHCQQALRSRSKLYTTSPSETDCMSKEE